MGVIVARRIIMLGGFPDFTFSGAHTIVDTGVDSGTWKIALTGSGTLTLNKKTKAIIQGQGGGGGGGASDGSTAGSDGTDGSIINLAEQQLEAGSYEIIIGAGGARGYDSAGADGGNTSFGNMLTAQGGASGGYAGGASQEHSSIYSSYGQGGLGGAIDQHDGELKTEYYYTINTSGYTYIRVSPNGHSGSNGTVKVGEYVLLTDNTKIPDERGTDENVYWYKLADGRGYVEVSRGTIHPETSDTRAWYGVAGNAGVIILSGKA